MTRIKKDKEISDLRKETEELKRQVARLKRENERLRGDEGIEFEDEESSPVVINKAMACPNCGKSTVITFVTPSGKVITQCKECRCR